MTRQTARRIASAAALALLSGCLPATTFHPRSTDVPTFRPEAFFDGTTHGDGVLEQRFKAKRDVQVEGYGAMQPDGVFVLEQRIRYGDGATEQRTWHLEPAGASAYTGSLTGASGVVRGEVHGSVFHVRYLLRQPGVYMDQLLYLQPDGRTVLNVSTVSVLGIPWARLSETITRVSADSAAR